MVETNSKEREGEAQSEPRTPVPIAHGRLGVAVAERDPGPRWMHPGERRAPSFRVGSRPADGATAQSSGYHHRAPEHVIADRDGEQEVARFSIGEAQRNAVPDAVIAPSRQTYARQARAIRRGRSEWNEPSQPGGLSRSSPGFQSRSAPARSSQPNVSPCGPERR